VPDTTSGKHRTGLEILKKKLQGNSKRPTEPGTDRQNPPSLPQASPEIKQAPPGKPKPGPSEGVDLSKYKKQVVLRTEKRAEESSTKPVRERGVDTDKGKKASRTVVN
jgi:hypothetical protein